MPFLFEPIDPAQVADLWPQIESHIAAACDPLMRPAHVRHQAITGRMVLWAARLDGRVVGALMCQFTDYSVARQLMTSVPSSAYGEAWLPDLLRAMQSWAHRWGATDIAVVGDCPAIRDALGPSAAQQVGWRAMIRPELHPTTAGAADRPMVH